MTLTDLARLEETATEGPWIASENDAPKHIGMAVVDTGRVFDSLYLNVEWNDANFIVALRNHAKALIACAEELRNIADAKRFSGDHFRDDTEFADWVKSRAIHTLRSLKEVR